VERFGVLASGKSNPYGHCRLRRINHRQRQWQFHNHEVDIPVLIDARLSLAFPLTIVERMMRPGVVGPIHPSTYRPTARKHVEDYDDNSHHQKQMDHAAADTANKTHQPED